MRALVIIAQLLCISCAGAPQLPARSEPKQQRVPERVACHVASDCLVLPRTCCGSCGAATPADSIAISRAWSRSHTYECTGGGGCPDCFQEPDPSLIATCRAGACRVYSVSESPLARCTRDEECVVRAASCCECGAREWLSIRRDRREAFQEIVCGRDTACPQCVGGPPANRIPNCHQGHCTVASIGSDAP